jgi:hypothetical protein
MVPLKAVSTQEVPSSLGWLSVSAEAQALKRMVTMDKMRMMVRVIFMITSFYVFKRCDKVIFL